MENQDEYLKKYEKESLKHKLSNQMCEEKSRKYWEKIQNPLSLCLAFYTSFYPLKKQKPKMVVFALWLRCRH